VQGYCHIGLQGDVEGIANDRSGVVFSLVHCDRSNRKTENSIGIAACGAHRSRDVPRNPQHIVL
jgi:hypothetical protein